jgi:photosystem II stability/assembly factor-like uncharacterized protein
MPRIVRCFTLAAFVVPALAVPALAQARRPQPQAEAPPAASDIAGQLRFRYIGPVGNRVTSAAGVPGDPSTYYVGAASGGVWKTVDGGVVWEPVFDEQPVQSIGSLAVAPSDPNTVWAGTGEDCIRSHISIGNGIYKSTDAGKTWSHMGLERTGRIGRLAIDPKNPDVVLACALGHAYGPQPERGVFRTTDGGKTWEKTLFVDENTGCSDIAMDPANPRIAFAGMWQFEMKTWGRESGGPGSGLFMTRDGGTTWKRLTGNGLPAKPVGKIAVAIAPSNPGRVYAIIETGDGVPYKGKDTERGTLWRSDDGGTHWRVVSYDHNVNGRAHYYSHLAVSPDNENQVYFLTSAFSVSLNGGETLEAQPFGRSPGGDNHEIWIDPTNSSRMIVANDGGTSISVDRGRTWMRVQLPIAQMYHATVDDEIPYNVLGNKQDGPSYRGPSNSRGTEGGGGFGGGGGPPAIPRSAWHGVEGGESGWATPDPSDSNVIWSSASGSGSVGGIVIRFDERSRQGRRVEVWPEATGGWPPADLKYRFNWTMPLAISPHDPKTIYVGSQHVHRTTDGGQSWEVISPDLSTNDKTRQQMSGGLTPDNIGVEYAFAVMAIAESRLEKGLIWAGTNDGQVQLTRDGGKTWTNVTRNIPSLPPWGTVGNIEPSRYDAGTAYLTVDLHQVGNRDPFVYKTADFGRTWKAITAGIPPSVTSYAHCIREDPVRRGLLYLGTESALHVSFDDGASWQPLQAGLPHAPVYWLVVQERFDDLVVSTYGRGFWILDDIAPLQQLTPQVREADAHLFAPRPAYRFRAVELNYASPNDPTAGRDPAYGATISYFLKTAPAGDVKLRILDSAGQLVRTLTGTKQAGINRATWDLRHEPSKEIRLRSSPLYAPDIRPGAEGWRTLPEGGRLTLMAPPGNYTVELAVGETRQKQPLVVRKDPHSAGTEADIQSQYAMLLEIRKDLETAAEMVNVIESLRSQVSGLLPLLEGGAGSTVRPAAQALETKLIEVEDGLIQRKLTGRGQDGTRWPNQLVSKLTYLASGVASVDFAPTEPAKQVHALLKGRLAASRGQLDAALARELPALNDLLKEQKVQYLIARAPAAGEGR